MLDLGLFEANSADLESWLSTKPLEWSQVIALRSALRVLPLVAEFHPYKALSDAQKADLYLATFRAIHSCWAVLRYPRRVSASYALQASRASSRIIGQAATITGAPDLARVPYAASDAAHSVGQADFQIAIRSIKNSEIAASSALASAKQSFWDGVDADVAKLIESASRDSSTNIQSAASQRIWRKGRPSWAYEAHRRLSQRIKLVNGPWDCWLEWYDARMKGLSDFSLSPQWSEEVSARISNQSDSWWAEGSAYANRHIGSWVQEALRVGGDQNKQTISGFIIE